MSEHAVNDISDLLRANMREKGMDGPNSDGRGQEELKAAFREVRDAIVEAGGAAAFFAIMPSGTGTAEVIRIGGGEEDVVLLLLEHLQGFIDTVHAAKGAPKL